MHYSTSGHAAASECVLQRMLTNCSTSCLYAFAAVMRGAAFNGAAYSIGHARAGPLAVLWASRCTSSHGKLPSSNATPGKCIKTNGQQLQTWRSPGCILTAGTSQFQSLQTSDSLSWVCRGRHGWRTCHTSGAHHLSAPATAPRIFQRAQRCALSVCRGSSAFEKKRL